MDNWHLVVNHLRHAIDTAEKKFHKTWRDKWRIFWLKRSLNNLQKCIGQLVDEGKR